MSSAEERLDQVEGIIHRSGLKGAGFLSGALRWRLCDKDGDGDMDPLTADNWGGDSYDDGDTGTIDWHGEYGVPPGARAVCVICQARDAGSSGGQYQVDLQAKSTTTIPSLRVPCPRSGDDHMGFAQGVVPIASDGTSYYAITASGNATLDAWIRVVAYAT